MKPLGRPVLFLLGVVLLFRSWVFWFIVATLATAILVVDWSA
jgi:hypothetical protein